MDTKKLPQRITNLLDTVAPIRRYINESPWSRLADKPDICDFAFGNPHEMPLPDVVDALQRWSVPQHKDWFAYKQNEPEAQAIVGQALSAELNLAFEAEDIFLTNGAFGAIPIILHSIVDPGDEIIFISPPWFFYEGLITHAGGVPVRVKIQPDTFDLDLEAIAAAITPKTRAIIVNSPHNPTGKIHPPETLEALAQLLTEASQRHDRKIYLLSDEAYRRVIFDGRSYTSPASFYPNTVIIYTYGKVLLTPGQRIGYLALPAQMPNREQFRTVIPAFQWFLGWAFPDAVLQYALDDFETLSIDIEHLQHKRDRVVDALSEIGYDVTKPEGTFYVMVRSPWKDDWSFVELLGEHDILCMPGAVVELPGYFRISLTANDEMIERAIPGFAAAWEKAIKH